MQLAQNQSESKILTPSRSVDVAGPLAAKLLRKQSVEQAALTEREVDALASGAKLIPLTQNRWAIVDAEDYDGLSKHFWLARNSGSNWYAERRIWSYANGKRYGKTARMHRVVLSVETFVDHINGDGLDNRKSNLRLTTISQNAHNRHRLPKNTSGFKGVHVWKKNGKFKAEIKVNYVNKSLGYFHSAIDAARAYDKAAIELHGEFATTNAKLFPEKLQNAS